MISKKKIIISLVTVFIFYLNAAAQYSLTLSIDEAKSKIRREIYGALLENWGRDIYGGLYVGRNSSIPNTNGMRNDIIEGLKECGISTLEFPGGCFADQYHWRDGIGSPDSRPGGDSKNGMGTDEYMQLCSLINAEPYFCANLKTGTPQEMAEWINYINKNSSHPDWYCKYWSMGNEPWGCGGDLTAAQFANQYAKFVEAIPDIEGKPQVRIAGAGHWSTDWVKAVFDKNPGKLEGFSVHRYLVNNWNDLAGPSINYNDFQYHQIIQLAFDASSFIRSFDQAMDQYDKDKKIGLMYNEWGAWYDEISSQGYTFSQSTVRDALIAAIHLNAFNNYCERVHLACVAQPVNVIQSIFLTDKNDQTRVVKTPVFYAFKLFKVHQNAKKIPVNLQTASFNEKIQGTNFSYPYLTASASIDSADNINITIANSDLSNAKDLAIQLNGNTTYQSVSGQIITASQVTALNDFGKAEQVNIQQFSDDNFTLSGKSLSVKVPSKSVILLTLTPKSTVTGNSSYMQSNHRNFAIKTTKNGKIVFNFSKVSSKPVKLALFGINGRIMAKTTAIAQQNGENLIEWQLQGIKSLDGMYILQVDTGDALISQKVTFTN